VRSLRSLYLAIGAASGCFFPFLVVILAGRGFGPAEIGVVTATASLAYMGSVPVWGHLGDVTIGRRRALQLGAVGAAIVVILFASTLPMLVTAFLVVAFSAFQSALQPLSDALALANVRDRDRDYARIRLLSSLSFAFVSIGCGVAYDRIGYWMTAPFFAISAAWIVVSVIGLRGATRGHVRPAAARDVPAAVRRSSRLGTTGEAFAMQPRLPLVLLAIGLVYLGVLASFSYLPLRITDLGGGPEMVALTAGISSLAEVPGMLVAALVVSRIGLRGLFSASCVGYAACIVSWIVIDVPVVIVATRAVTGFAFGGILVASALTVGSLLPGRLQATGQALYQTTAFGVAAFAANLFGGLIYAAAGPSLLWALTAIAAVGAAVVGVAVFPARGAVTAPTDDPAAVLALVPEREVPLGL
jgi:PPP family 3-phenylpropionic acid transporter